MVVSGAVVSGVVAYPRGFSFYVATISRTGAEGVALERHMDEPWGSDLLRPFCVLG